jgi:L,D-transpeptidase ErfK/SrfK
MKISIPILVTLTAILISANSQATTYQLPAAPGDSLIGELPETGLYTRARKDDTLLDIALAYDIGQNEIVRTNPNVDRWLPGQDTEIRIPDSRLLPDTKQRGLILNLPEYRLYYYPKDQPGQVITHPISIGRMDWDTPLGTTKIIAKTKDPQWRPPASIKAEHAAQGDPLPDVVPAGPNNPLGRYAMRLGIPGYLIHSTNKPLGVGMRVSHGCVRMYPNDIERLFPIIKTGTPVEIVNQPIKVGWLNNKLYIEVYPELEGQESGFGDRLAKAMDLIQKLNSNVPVLDTDALRDALTLSNGLPVAIYQRPENNYEMNNNFQDTSSAN